MWEPIALAPSHVGNDSLGGFGRRIIFPLCVLDGNVPYSEAGWDTLLEYSLGASGKPVPTGVIDWLNTTYQSPYVVQLRAQLQGGPGNPDWPTEAGALAEILEKIILVRRLQQSGTLEAWTPPAGGTWPAMPANILGAPAWQPPPGVAGGTPPPTVDSTIIGLMGYANAEVQANNTNWHWSLPIPFPSVPTGGINASGFVSPVLESDGTFAGRSQVIPFMNFAPDAGAAPVLPTNAGLSSGVTGPAYLGGSASPAPAGAGTPGTGTVPLSAGAGVPAPAKGTSTTVDATTVGPGAPGTAAPSMLANLPTWFVPGAIAAAVLLLIWKKG